MNDLAGSFLHRWFRRYLAGYSLSSTPRTQQRQQPARGDEPEVLAHLEAQRTERIVHHLGAVRPEEDEIARLRRRALQDCRDRARVPRGQHRAPGQVSQPRPCPTQEGGEGVHAEGADHIAGHEQLAGHPGQFQAALQVEVRPVHFAATVSEDAKHIMGLGQRACISGALSQFERALIRERQREGIAIAKTKGVYKGRKPALDEAGKTTLREMAAAGMPKTDIAEMLGISRASVYEYLRH